MKKTTKNASNEKNTSDNRSRIIPLADKVLIRVDDTVDEKKNDFGIIIPDTASKERPERGKVIAIGEGKLNDEGGLIPMRVRVGDRVIFSKYGFDEVKAGDEEYILVSESNILAIIK